MKNIFLVIVLSIFSSSLLAQKKKINCTVIDFFIPPKAVFQEKLDKNNKKLLSLDGNDYIDIYNRVGKIQDYVLEKLVKDKRFNLVERNKLNLIKKERELQKSEDFIDGYVVEQGQAIGTDYLILGDFDLSEMSMTISVYSVADNKLIASESAMLKKPLNTNFMSIKKPINKSTDRLIAKFAPNYISLLEIIKEKKGKAKIVLIAGGSGRGLEKGDDLEFKIKEERDVDGEILIYYRTIGKGEVEKIEDQNFSIVSVGAGGKEIKTLIGKNEKVICSKVIK